MGEYISIKGASVKLGTCENLYYVRFEELQQVVGSGLAEKLSGNLEPGEYLTTDGFRYRFPFPDEDGQTWPEWMKREFDRGLMVGVPRPLAEMDHGEIWRGLSAGGAFNVNVATPCPVSKAFEGLKSSPLPDSFPLAIKQQRRIGDELWVVVACGWCGHKVRLTAEDAGALADHIKDNVSDRPQEYWREVARRIMAGYKLER